MKKVFVLVVFLSGCASGFHREELRAQVDGQAEIRGEAIAEELSLRPQLPKPFRLAVAFQEPIAGHEGERKLRRWSAEEKEILLSLPWPKDEVNQVSHLLSDGGAGGVGAIRLAAAKQRADAVLLVSGGQETQLSSNGLSAFYLLLVPMLFLKGTEVESLFIARATLWDVRNGFQYLGAEAESEAVQARPRMATKWVEQAVENRKKALERLKIELARQFQGILG